MAGAALDVDRTRWRKSSRSGGGGGAQCVEVAFVDDGAAIRDSKNPAGLVCRFAHGALALFIAQVQAGRIRTTTDECH